MQRTILPLALVLLSIAVPASAQKEPGKLALICGKVLTMDEKDTVHDNVVVFIGDGKIERIVPIKSATIPPGYEVHDHSNKWLVPGLIDCHNHTGTDASNDLHDYVWLTNAGLRAGDMIGVDTKDNRRSLAGGVTTALLIPGSGTNMSGFGGIVRFGALTQEEAIMRSPASLKIAQAGNPERWYFGPRRTYMNYNLRQTLEKARRYHEAWNAYESGQVKEKPDFDQTWEDFRKLFRREIPVTVHTQMFQVVSKTMTMLVDEFGLRVVIDHGTFDAYKAASLAVERDLYAAVGPRIWWMDEQDRTFNSCAGSWYDRGLRKIGLNTDAGVMPQEDLRIQASTSVWHGYRSYPALQGLTRFAAEQLGVADRIGSIKPGLEADVVVWGGDPLDYRSGVDRVYAFGRIAYDATARRLY